MTSQQLKQHQQRMFKFLQQGHGPITAFRLAKQEEKTKQQQKGGK